LTIALWLALVTAPAGGVSPAVAAADALAAERRGKAFWKQPAAECEVPGVKRGTA
jgi:hypothetical protein